MKNFIGIPLFCILVMVPLFAKADVNSMFGISIPELDAKYFKNKDNSYIITASLRCSAINMVAYKIMKRDFPSKNWEGIDQRSEDYYIFSMLLREAKKEERGISTSLKESTDRAYTEIAGYVEVYSNWMGNNYKINGDYIESSPGLLSDYSYCIESHDEVKRVLSK